MIVYFKVSNMYSEDGKFIWKWFTDLDPKSNTFDYLVRKNVEILYKEFDGIDGYINKSGPTVNGDWVVEFSVISKDTIKEEAIDVWNPRGTHPESNSVSR